MKDTISLEAIRSALHEVGDPWQAGETAVSSLPVEEKERLLGVSPPPGEPDADQVAQRWPTMEESIKVKAFQQVAAPAAYDLRNVGGKNYITAVRDQGGCGSCVAFGTTAAVEGKTRLQRNDPSLAIDLSEAHLFFCLGKETGASCSDGWWPSKALDAYKAKGVAAEACYPYASGIAKHDCSGLCSNSADQIVKVTGYVDLTGKPDQIKEWLATRGPVTACFVVYDDFFSYKSGVYRHVSGEQRGGHCVVIVGYNDTPGYWICKNSWNTTFGEQGFFNIAYGQCGIDTWNNLGIEAIGLNAWYSNRRVTALWTIAEELNAWVMIEALGWRKVASDNANGFLNMLSELIAAKAGARPVSFYEENNVIKQVYAF